MSSLKGLWKLLAPFHKRFYFFLVLAVVYESFAILDSYVLSFSIEKLGVGSLKNLAIWIGIILVIDEINMRLDNKFDWEVVVGFYYEIYKYLKIRMLTLFLDMDISWHHQQKSGALLGKINNGVDKVCDLTMTLGWEVVPTTIQLFISAIPLSFINPWCTLIIFVAFVIFVALTIRQLNLQKPYRVQKYTHYEEEWAHAMNAVNNIEIVQLHNGQHRVRDEFTSIHQNLMDQGVKEVHIGVYIFNRWKIRVSSYARRAILGLLLYQTLQGQISVGELVFAWTLTEKLMHSFWRIARLFDRVAESSEGIKRLVDTAELRPEIQSPHNAPASANDQNTISLSHVSYAHPTENSEEDETCITDLSLTIEAGESIAIVGPSGAGKSTLVKLLPRLIDVTAGVVTIGGTNVTEWELSELRGMFALVSQDYAVMDGTFTDNIALGDYHATQTQIVSASQKAGIHEFIMSTPLGYETQLGERGILLSGGQKQRVALARAFLKMPHILILDEPTSALDSQTEAKLQEALEEFYKDPHVTVIVIAHRLATIKNCNRIVVMDEGHIVEEGTHEELIGNHGIYANLHELQNIS
ncbi:hypothetical protein CO179_04550 [candidate division WWE3 bacterium CG_4_9_14_3_um_filter_39_7]|uniref:ABC transporter ATP-binding protein n=1 Tax=candidate division WWE3 bacterium CG_4_9_14_3_um_filter_39_7 TaxID=1975080 RepID=A0A2M7X0R8_UNCKA|nr:MAG: hypothetical protein CO179_04550 [candidate division WWE3 bacterium CG_4_9_14_3_um_filter_39_7]